MMTRFHYPCTRPGCKNYIGQKAHEYCQSKGLLDTCYDHQTHEIKPRAGVGVNSFPPMKIDVLTDC